MIGLNGIERSASWYYAGVIKRCLSGEIDLDDLELWANVIESREDVDCAQHEGVIYALSNSEQMGELDHQKLEKILALLKD